MTSVADDPRSQPTGARPPLRTPLPPPPPAVGDGDDGPPPRRRRGFLSCFLALALLGMAGGAMILFLGGLGMLSGLEELGGVHGTLVERTVERGSPGSSDKIAVIDLSGMIMGGGSFPPAASTVRSLKRRFRRAADDRKVKAVILRVNSPGGGLTASDILYHELCQLKNRKPVVVWVEAMAASGAYYISAPSSYIVASPTSLVGSIGVIMERFMLKGLLEDKLGIKPDPIMAGKSKDIGSMFREMRPAERKYFERMLAHFHDRFIAVVARGRGLERDQVRRIADGRVYVPEEAKRYGLIDEIGYFERAVAKANELAGVSGARLVRYAKPPNILSLLRSGSQAPGVRLPAIKRLLAQLSTPRVLLVWKGE